VRVVAGDFDVLELILEDRGGFAFEDELWQGARRALELLLDAFDLVEVNVAIAAGPDKIAGFQITLLGDQVCQ